MQKFMSQDQGEDWERLKKRLDEAVSRTLDAEILAALRRIGEAFPDKLTDENGSVIKSIMSQINKLRKDAKNGEVQAKAASLIKRYQDKFSKKVDVGGEKDIRKNMDEKVNKMKEAGQKVQSVDQENAKGTRTIDPRKTVPQSRRR